MKDFFASIYELFVNVYGTDLGEHLYGVDCAGNVEGGLYSGIGLGMIILTLILVVVYYYAYVNPDRSRWYHWLIWLLGNFLLQFLIAFYLPYRDLNSGFICESFLVTVDNTVFFGLINAIISAIFFILFSYLLRWWSPDGRQTPIPR